MSRLYEILILSLIWIIASFFKMEEFLLYLFLSFGIFLIITGNVSLGSKVLKCGFVCYLFTIFVLGAIIVVLGPDRLNEIQMFKDGVFIFFNMVSDFIGSIKSATDRINNFFP